MEVKEKTEIIRAIKYLLKQKTEVESQVILKNFNIGRLVKDCYAEGGDDAVVSVASAMSSSDTPVFEDFFYKAKAVFETYKSEQRLLEVGKKLGPHFTWGFLTKQCFKPKDGSRAASLYVDGVLTTAEKAIGAVEDLIASDIPDTFKHQAEGVLTYLHRGEFAAPASADAVDAPHKFSKVLHTGDLHYREKGLAEIKKSGDFIIAQAAIEKPNLIVIAGDLCDERHFYDSRPFKEAVDFVRRMADIAPVFLLKGTTNHDGYDIDIFAELSTRHPVCAADQIDCIGFGGGRFGPIQDIPAPDAVIFALPPVNKANLMAYSNTSMEDSRLEAIDLLRDILQMWGQIAFPIKAAGVPVIGTGHITVMGAELSTGQELVGRDIEVGLGDLALANVDAWLLDHIHKAQRWGNVFYSGSTARLNYGEKEEKGFWMHEFSPEGLKSRFVVIPTREMVTVDFEEAPSLDLITDIPADGKVRVRYKVKEEDVHSVDESEIKRKLLEMGASEVKIEKTVIPTVRVRAEGISKANGARGKLEKWASTTGTQLTEGIYDKLELIEIEEAPTAGLWIMQGNGSC